MASGNVSESRSMVLEILEVCPALGKVSGLDKLITAVIEGTGGNLSALEAAIAERGQIDDEIAAGFMGVGAMAEVAMDLVGERAELVLAGRAVGRMMRKHYAAKIAAELEKQRGATS